MPECYSDAQGVQAIIDLQGLAGIKESKEDAAKGWLRMPQRDRINTTAAHKVLFPHKKENHEEEETVTGAASVGGVGSGDGGDLASQQG